MRDWLKEGAQESVGGCFLYPGCGSYEPHESACEPSVGVRADSWARSWVAEGFRSKAGKTRSLCAWQESGGALHLARLNLNDEALAWRTRRPPNNWQSPEYFERLWARGWVSESGAWRGPLLARPSAAVRRTRPWRLGPETAAAPASLLPSARAAPGERHTIVAGSASPLWALVNDPDSSRRTERGDWVPITRLAEELCCDRTALDPRMARGDLVRRERRHRRRALAAYCRRVFSVGEAGLWARGCVFVGVCVGVLVGVFGSGFLL